MLRSSPGLACPAVAFAAWSAIAATSGLECRWPLLLLSMPDLEHPAGLRVWSTLLQLQLLPSLACSAPAWAWRAPLLRRCFVCTVSAIRRVEGVPETRRCCEGLSLVVVSYVAATKKHKTNHVFSISQVPTANRLALKAFGHWVH